MSVQHSSSAAASAVVEKPIVVLKFGSSVLGAAEDVPAAVSEIYRVVRTGRRVVAVTSAFLGMTDALIAESNDWGCAHDNLNAAAYIATGEEMSAALTALACDQAGLSSIALKAPELGIVADGPWDSARPIAMSAPNLKRALSEVDVVVVPGFVATNADGRTVLLGRGGSDLTALFLARVLQAERVRLVKDVDGVYESDPAEHRDVARFRHIDWSRVRKVAGTLIQQRALDFASEHDIAFEVGAIGSDDVTRVSDIFAPPSLRPTRRKLRVALAGLGVVGAGVARRLLQRPDAFEIAAVLVRDPERQRDVKLASDIFTTEPSELFAENVDVLVDVLSCAETGAALTQAALASGIDVVSANKQAIVPTLFGQERLAQPRIGARLLYSAAVGGGAPLLETIARAKSARVEIVAISGVFNGTINFVLELLATGMKFEDALAEAQRAGLAESDPTADLKSHDAVAKLRLVAHAAFGETLNADEIEVETLDERCAKRAMQTRLKQIASVQRQGSRLAGAVTFEAAYAGPFANLTGDRNAIRILAKDGRVFTASGRGAGRWPTTESVLSDLVDLSLRQ